MVISEKTKQKISATVKQRWKEGVFNKRKDYSRRHLKYKTDSKGCMRVISHKPDINGYVSLERNGKRIGFHKFIYESTYGMINKGQVIRHKCDVKSCINPYHLEVGTPKQNSEDMVNRNRQSKGVKRHNAKLNKVKVKAIRKLLPVMSSRVIAKKYGVTKSTILCVKNNKTWRHI